MSTPEDPNRRRVRKRVEPRAPGTPAESADHGGFTEGTPAENLPAPGTAQPARDLSQVQQNENDRLATFKKSTEDEAFKPDEAELKRRSREKKKEIRKNPTAAPDWDQDEEELSALEAARLENAEAEGLEKKEKSRRKRKEEASGLETFFGKVSKVFYVFAALVVIGLIFLGTWGISKLSDKENVALDAPERVDSGGQLRKSLSGLVPIKKEELDAAQNAVSQFLQADGYAEKAVYISDKEAAFPLMEEWYGRPENVGKDKIESLGQLLQVKRANFGSREFVMLAAYVAPTNRIQYFATESLDTDDGSSKFGVHWQTTMGYQEVGLDDFISRLHLEPVSFRVAAVPSDYYNGPYSDSERYFCVKLLYPGDPNFTLWAYADRDEEFTELLENSFMTQRGVNLTLKLKHLPNQDLGSLRQAQISEIDSMDWFPDYK